MKETDKPSKPSNPVIENSTLPTDSPAVMAEEATHLVTEVIGAMANATPAAVTIRPMAVSTDLVSELNNIDFAKMIGGPLQAAIQAQTASAIATVNFIKDLGFKPVDPEEPDGAKELVMTDFSYKKKDVNPDTGEIIETERFVRIPFIAMLPIPSIRIETVDIDFNVKLNSVESQTIKDKLAVGLDIQGGWGPVSFKVSASYQRSSAYGVEVKKEYSMNVKVKASQDEMPAGLEKIMGMLSA
ncbi:DUF2589 domain-containing protein [Thiothrix subterranea]|uniref:DUF2589 domain-containing protein n=1 Tax=Thiothrix subterranea TaxID=2735563 RepID=UPI00192A8F62|nr:DUF2589 domain-containing protein [Thiothrix subterranea]QQZ28038.1 DUF2589 domain-containing protein [Thiothrix subterranea]